MAEQRKTDHRIVKRWIVVIGFGLVVATVALALLFGRGSSNEEGRPVPEPSGAPVLAPSNEAAAGTRPQPGEITITLSSDRIDSAQIKTEVATRQANTSATDAGGMRTTGIVQSNAYKETPVFPVAGGVVREVNAQLGDRVRRDQPLAVLFSTELADAEGEYLKKLAELEEHHKHHQRATELVEIGAISREEFEQATSNFKTAQANVSPMRERLTLLGVTPQQLEALRSTSQVKSLISVTAPASGTIINRAVNTGEVVDKGKELFRVADLSTVWVIGQIYEIDFTKALIGTHAAITTTAYPGRTFSGVVSYIDPRVDPNTRTAQVRIEVANPGEMLKLGMFLDVSFGGAAITTSGGRPVVLVPRSAVQTIGAKQVVFVASEQQGVFIQREVTAGPETNDLVPIYSGLKDGERVVTVGSFLLSAESLKLNPTQSTGTNTQPSTQPRSGVVPAQETSPRGPGEPAIQTARVVLSKDGYKPASITVRRDILVRLTFVRQIEETCGTEISIPEYNIKRELPLNEPVVVEFTPTRVGEIIFVCGMNMLRGKIVVK
ncbi:MAG TPA: efflux RND transporter periplasmic adaptor subunit [Blastocatellia bacterium]|jgi:RND family efflux transporter MFP subunit|nr:efflux RND transporter periplasmic adaptor subunit [Blastocatellia bacterium]